MSTPKINDCDSWAQSWANTKQISLSDPAGVSQLFDCARSVEHLQHLVGLGASCSSGSAPRLLRDILSKYNPSEEERAMVSYLLTQGKSPLIDAYVATFQRLPLDDAAWCPASQTLLLRSGIDWSGYTITNHYKEEKLALLHMLHFCHLNLALRFLSYPKGYAQHKDVVLTTWFDQCLRDLSGQKNITEDRDNKKRLELMDKIMEKSSPSLRQALLTRLDSHKSSRWFKDIALSIPDASDATARPTLALRVTPPAFAAPVLASLPALSEEEVRLLFDKERHSVKDIEILLHHGADLTALNKRKRGLLYEAVRVQNAAVCDALIKAGLSPNVLTVPSDSQSDTLLTTAACISSPKVVATLLGHGADPNARAHPGAPTPWMAAAMYGNIRNLELLKGAGADIHAVDDGGNNALFHAVQVYEVQRIKHIIQYLVDAGVDPLHRNNAGETFADVFERHTAQQRFYDPNASVLQAALKQYICDITADCLRRAINDQSSAPAASTRRRM